MKYKITSEADMDVVTLRYRELIEEFIKMDEGQVLVIECSDREDPQAVRMSIRNDFLRAKINPKTRVIENRVVLSKR